MGPRHFSRGIWRIVFWISGTNRLQWGRGISAAESVVAPPPVPHLGLASMGPRHFSRGIWFELDYPVGLGLASMGPQHFSRGIRPRGRGVSTTCRFNGAAAFQPRNRWRTTRTRTAHAGFNGAAAFQPRNQSNSHGYCRGDMLQWGRGISAAESDDPPPAYDPSD